MPAPEAGDVRTHGEVLALVTHLAQNLASALALPYGVASLLLAGTDFDAETAALRASTPSGLRRQLRKCVGVAELAGDAALGKVEETTTGDDGCPYCMDDLFSGAADDAAVAPGWCNHAAHRSCWLEYLEHEVRANPCHAPIVVYLTRCPRVCGCVCMATWQLVSGAQRVCCMMEDCTAVLTEPQIRQLVSNYECARRGGNVHSRLQSIHSRSCPNMLPWLRCSQLAA